VNTVPARTQTVRYDAARQHELKSWPHLFEPLFRGEKTHDLRRSDDRDFAVGDTLLLREFDPALQAYTGRECSVEITYITSEACPCALSEEALGRDFSILSVRKLGTL